ncbi:sensor histidine kinase [Rhodanobacter lindaniclasticus]|uniref:histidine kinase n=1 Tax=Rhodanobacter lindaniclasticus TaxID=75310 RepID=A0A4S3KLZ5_9GAMM|nr:HAMP domain-containing sensor histidine kinase [Rhodanobacter lindaniclasticus]THD09902.1 histidine kinase [Rhodanobacter lindaniclasticus]
MNSRVSNAITFRTGAFKRRIAWVFGLQFVALLIIGAMGIFNVAPWEAVIVLIFITTVLACLAAQHEWVQIRSLARLMAGWNDAKPDPEAFHPQRLSRRTDADVASLARGLHGFATRIAGYGQRERNFTRDASHELRSPLTVIRMSVDMLADEKDLSEFGTRSVRRIKRASRELEMLVEALLVLARDAGTPVDTERFVVNDVLQGELQAAREMLCGRPIELRLEQPAAFALDSSPRVFSVLCWQLLRNACQQAERGSVVVRVDPGMVSVRNLVPAEDATDADPGAAGADRHGFELAIARQISDRFGWPLDLKTHAGQESVACIRFPDALPASAAAERAP